MEPRSVWNIGAQLGEGPIWIEDALWFVDIKRRKIHRFDPDAGEGSSWDAPEQVGFVVPRERGGLIAGLQSGLFGFDPGSGRFERIVAVDEHLPGNRLNDGVVNRQGRLWFGTMNDGEREKTGSFYCYSGGELKPTGLSGIAITNGPAVSPDGRTLYWVDTLEKTVSAAEIRDDGALGESRLFVRIGEGDGNPDGPAVDSEGCVWVSLYGGWQVQRYSAGGELLEQVRFPVANITKVAFGGKDRRRVFATTARHLLTQDELAGQPQAGDLFAFDAPVAGLPGWPVKD